MVRVTPLAAALLLAAVPVALADDKTTLRVPRGWATGEQWDDTIAALEKSGKPLVILKHRLSPKAKVHDEVAQGWTADPRLRGLPGIVVFDEQLPDGFGVVEGQIAVKADYGPNLYIINPAKQVVGFVSYKSRDALADRLALAQHVLAWQATADRRIEQAEKLAQGGRFGRAFEAIGPVIEQDVKVSHRVRTAWNEDADRPPRETLPGLYYRTLDSDLTEAWNALADKRIEDAREHIDAGRYTAAIALLRPMAADPTGRVRATQDAARVIEDAHAAMKADAERRRAEREAEGGDEGDGEEDDTDRNGDDNGDDPI